MIVTELYDGQGLGNQLWSYVVTRVLALDRGFEFGIINPEKFKGSSFLSLDFGKQVLGGGGPEGGPPIKLPEGIKHYFAEKEMWFEKYKCDVRGLDQLLLDIDDDTKIEGYFQSEDLILHRKSEIKTWLKVKSEHDCFDFSDENICILNIRGGEYKGNPDLLLSKKYWNNAIANMRDINGKLDFVIITDDLKYANKIFPELQAYHFNIGTDYSIVKNAKYLILSNSSFSFFPAWTSETVKYVIAPKYWARHNISDGFWACEFNIYRDWLWQDRSGKLIDYKKCVSDLLLYQKAHNFSNFGPRALAASASWQKKLLIKAAYKLLVLRNIFCK